MAVLLTLSSKVAAQTGCDSVALPFSEDFDQYGAGDDVIPHCWYATRNYDSGLPPHIDAAQHSNGTASMVLYPGSFAGSHYSMVIMPPVAADRLEGLRLRFRFMAASTAARLEVGLCVDTLRQYRAFTPLDTLHVDQAMRWQDVEVDLGRYLGQGRRIAFRMQRSLQADGAACWIDAIRIETCGISTLHAEHIGSTVVTLVFDTYGQGEVQVSYGDTTIANALSPLTINGLQPNTEYTFTVGCADGLQHSIQVTTMEGAGLVPAYYETFADGLPAGWRFPAGGTPSVVSGRLRLTPTGGDSCVAVLPLQEAAPIDDLNVAMLLAGSGTTRLVVGVMEYADEPESFIPVDTLECTTAEQTRLVSLSRYSGQGNYIAFMALGSGTVAIGEVRVARCLLNNLRLYNLTESEVTIAWDTLVLTGGVQLEYGQQGFAHGEGTLLLPDENPYTISGLTTATSYDFYLWPTCGDSVCLYDKLQATTFAHSVLPPYCTDFEEDALPQGWVGNAASRSTNSYSGTGALRLAAGGRATLPLMGMASPDTVVLEFYATGAGILSVGTTTDAYTEPEIHTTLTSSGWQHYRVNLTGVSGRCITLAASGIWTIDALTIHTAVLTSVSAGGIGQHSAVIRWQLDGADSVRMEYSIVEMEGADFAEGSGTTLVAADSIALEGLASDSYYTVHLWPMGDAEGCYPEILHFQTLADSVSIPFCENFEGIATSSYPSQWRRRSSRGEYPIVSNERNNTGSRSLHFAATATQITTAILPDADGCSTHRTLAFWTNVTANPQGAMLIVGTMTDIDDDATFTGSDTIHFTDIETWHHHEIALVPTAGHLAMRLVGAASETHLYVDDLCLEACAARNVRLSSVQQNTATLTWNGVGVAGVLVYISGGITRTDTFYTSPALIEGLGENQTYTVDVEAMCECGGTGVAYSPGGATNGRATNKRIRFVLNTLPSSTHLPICNTFESISTGNYPSGWRRRGTAAVSDRNYYLGGHSLSVDSGSYVILPQINSSGPIVASFYAYSPEAGMLTDSAILIGLTTNPDSAARMEVRAALSLTALGEWCHVAALLGESVESGKFVVFYTRGDVFLDNISVARFGIGDASVTSSGVIDWQQWHCTSVTIEYGPSGFTVGSGTDTSLTTSPFTLPELAPRQSYDIYLTPVGSSTGCQSVKLALGSSTGIPYCEDFDLTPSGGMPHGWNIGRTYGGTPTINIVDGSNTLYMKGISTARSMAVLPKLAVDSLSDLQLSLAMKSSNSQRALLLVGEVSDAADPNTFVPHDTLQCPASSQWYILRVALAGFDNAKRIALACEATAQNAEVWIDSIGITRGLTPDLSVVSARRVRVVSAEGAAEYLEYGPIGFEQGQGTVVHIDSSPYYIENLMPDSSYWFYSRSDSDAVTCLSPISVSMPTEVGLPYCLTRDTLEQLVLPEFGVDSMSQLHLYFNLYGSSRVAVGVMEQRGDWSSFYAFDTVASPSPDVHISFNYYSGIGRFVAMRAIGGGNFVIDNLRVSRCPLPMVALEDDGSVVIRGDGAVEYNGIRVVVNDSLTLANLDDTTLYEFYTLCDTDDVACGTPTSIVTTMTVGLPYCVDLTYGVLPAGWTVESGTAIVTGGVLNMTAGTIVRLPVLPIDTAVLEYEELTAGVWRLVQQTIEGSSRTLLLASTPRKLRSINIGRCALPPELDVSQPGNGTLTLGWDSVYSGFLVAYRLTGDSLFTIVPADTQPLTLSVESDTTYEFLLMCDTNDLGCRQPLEVRTLATSVTMPYCIEPGSLFSSLPEGWRTVYDAAYVYYILPQPSVDSLRRLNITLSARSLTSATRLVVGTMSDAARYETFDSVASFQLGSEYTRCFHSLRNYYGAGRFVALRVPSGSRLDIERLVVGECAAFDIEVVSHEADHIVLEWQSMGNPLVTVEYGEQGFDAGSGITVGSSESPLHIDSLSPLTNYTFYVTPTCPAQDSICPPIPIVDTFLTFTPQGGTGCIDYTDLTASYVSCYSGSYNNPSLVNGAIDYGYLSASSRHTVHFDTSERDPRTEGLLRTVPEGEASSVRLGNWLAGGNDDPQAESLTYALNVDSGDIDLLLLQYAAVLQDAEHAPSLQPRFRLEILNTSGALVDSCGMVDFIANADLGWNQAPEDVLWKDWTTVGLDLTPYAGQTIFIRLTTYDCGEGSHFGYAYFTLRCAAKRMETEGCSDVPSNRFTVPSGFNYSWTANESDSIISTARSILVPSDNEVTYYCHLTSIDNPACGFDMSAFAGARYPLALFDTAFSVSACMLTLQLTDRSTISFDGHNPVGTGEPCETIRWLLPGDTSTAAQQTLVFSDTTTVDITLVAGIASDQCLDTVTQRIHIAYPYPHAVIDGDTVRCFNDDSSAISVHYAASIDWGDTISYFAPASDTIVSAITVDTNGCIDTLHHLLVVHPVYLIADSDTVCSSNLSYAWRDTSLSFTFADSNLAATLYRSSQYGCDSTMTLALNLHSSYDIHHYDTTCDNHSLPFFDTSLAATGVYLHPDTTLNGCDSLVTMHLTVHPTYNMDDPREVCDSLRWRDGVLYLADTIGATDSLLTSMACDSVIMLSLVVHPSYMIADSDTVCASNLSFAWRDTTVFFTFADSALTATLYRSSQYGCDSTMTLALNLHSSYDIHHYDTTCDNHSLPFFDTSLVTTGVYLHPDTTLNGCDSLVTMHLTVHPTYAHNDIRQACDSLRWTDGQLYLSDTVGAIDTMTSIHVCDSVMTLHLSVYPSYLAVERDTFCSGTIYSFRAHSLTSGGYYADTLVSIHQCDSILAIDLTERPLPHVAIRVEHLCNEGRYLLHADTDVPFTGWNWGRPLPGVHYMSTDSIVYVSPSSTMQYILTAGYDDEPRCIANDTVELSPFVMPQAVLRVSPQSLTPENTHYDAYDSGQEYLYRRWFVDGERLPGNDRHIEGYANPDADTLRIALVVGTLHCSDTTCAALAIRHQALFIPNAFTPGADSNREFFVVGKNIASFEISIYNREGLLVFTSSDINSPWDGTGLSGNPCPTGNYVYQIRYSTIYQPSAFQSQVGMVLLIR